MFNCADSIAVYERYRAHYTRFGGENASNIAKEVVENFFDFTPMSNSQYARELKKTASKK